MCFNEIFISEKAKNQFRKDNRSALKNKQMFALPEQFANNLYIQEFTKNYSEKAHIRTYFTYVSENKTLQNTYFKSKERAIIFSYKSSTASHSQRFSVIFAPENSMTFSRNAFQLPYNKKTLTKNIFQPSRNTISGYIYQFRFLSPVHLPAEMHLSNYDGYFKPYLFTDDDKRNNTYFSVPKVEEICYTESGYQSSGKKSRNAYETTLPHNKNMLFIGEEADKFTFSYLDTSIFPQKRYTETLYVIPIKKDIDMLSKK